MTALPNTGLSLTEWRARQVEDVVLPSGLAVKVKRVGLKELAAQGRIPETLLGIIQQAMDGSGEEGGPKIKIQLKDLGAIGEAYDLVAKACLVYPKVANQADDEHLSVDEIPFEDKEFIFERSNQEAVSLAPFPSGSAASGGASPDVEIVRETA
jgi:hypothetical protein